VRSYIRFGEFLRSAGVRIRVVVSPVERILIKSLCLFLFFSVLTTPLWAQSIDETSFYQPRPKILEFSVESLPTNSNIQLDPSQELTNFDPDRNNLVKARINFPVVYQPKLKVFGSVSYRRETLRLVTADPVPQPERLRLYQTGLNFRYEIQLKNQQFLMGHLGANMRSDQLDWGDLSYAASFGWGKQLNPAKKIGFGLGVENAWGRIRYSPLFLYEHRISQHWDLSLLLPRKARISYLASPALHLYAEAKGGSARYLLDHTNLLNEYSELEYRQRRVSFHLGVEKRIYDWFWVSAQAGITTPINSVLVERAAPTREHVFDFQPNSDRFVKFSVFIVPPQKLLDKLKK